MSTVPLFKPYMPDNLPELNDILSSGSLSYGQWGRLFEKKLGEYIGQSNILAVNSFNSAMLIALTTIGIKPEDEIIASPMSCLASNQPFINVGAKVIWADIDPLTGTLDPESVRKKITRNTKAIFHNHFCGFLGYIDEINAIGKEKGLLVVDDAIEAFGSEYKGKPVGNSGSDITVFSFQTVRIPNTIDGGAIAFASEELYQKAQLVRDYGIDRKKFRDSLGEISPQCDISLPGFGATINEINSYIGVQQMEVVNQLLNKQRKNAECWKEQLESAGFRILGKQSWQLPNYWVMGILSDTKNQTIVDFREKGYYASGVHFPNNKYSVFRSFDHLQGVEEFNLKFVALPCGWWL